MRVGTAGCKVKIRREDERDWKRSPRTQDEHKNKMGVRKRGCSRHENDGNELCYVGGNSTRCLLIVKCREQSKNNTQVDESRMEV